MKPIQIISQDLFDKVRSRFSNLEMGDETGAVTIDPAEARFFDFDFVREGVDLGRVSISINDLGSLKVYYSQGITEGQDIIGKKLWYMFLKEMRYFAMRRLLRFDTRDITKTNLDKNDFQHLAATQGPKEENMPNIAEGRWNGRSSSKTSRAVKGRTEVIIRHNKPVEEKFPGARSQRKNIKAIFIQNRDGERFKYPFIHPAGAFAMAQHVDHGGAPHDPAGKAIISMSEEIAQLAEFQKTIRGATLHDDALGITERAVGRLQELKAQIEILSKRPHYESWISEFTATEDDGLQAELDAVTMEDYKAKFTQKNYQEELSQYFPLLHRIMSEANKVNLESYFSETDQVEEQAQESVSETLPPGKLDQAFAEWAEDAASMEFDAAKLAQALQELPQPFTLSDEIAVDEVVRFFSEYGVESPELTDNLKDQARINPSADPIQNVIMPWAQKPENQDKFPGLLDIFQVPEEPAAAPTAKPAPEQPVAEDSDIKAMIGEVAKIVKSFYNRDNPYVGPFRGEEGIAIDVEKAISEKFGEKAGQHARSLAEKFMAKLTQEWSQRHSGHSIMGEKEMKEGPNDGKEDNFTIDDIKRLEQIKDFETLKAQAKELIKGKSIRRMKPEKISWFYNHLDTLKKPMAVIKMMYDLLLAGEGHRVIGSRNSMNPNSYRSRFGEDEVLEDSADTILSKIALSGDDAYDMIYDGMMGKLGDEIRNQLQNMYDSIADEYRLHHDNDFEEIQSHIVDRLEQEYGYQNKAQDDAAIEAMSRHAKGYEKYGKQGMDKLRRAAQSGAGEEKMDQIRKQYNKYDEDFDIMRKLAGLAK
jgi:hypothetical protein